MSRDESRSRSLTAEVAAASLARATPSGFDGHATNFLSDETARVDALVSLLASGVVAYLKDGEEHSEADEPETLFEDHSACSNFSFDQAASLDLEQEEGS